MPSKLLSDLSSGRHEGQALVENIEELSLTKTLEELDLQLQQYLKVSDAAAALHRGLHVDAVKQL